MSRHPLVAASLVAALLIAACGPDWDVIDPSLGSPGSSGSSAGGSSGSDASSASSASGAGGGVCADLDDDNECTTDSCVAGASQHVPVTLGTACGADDSDVCNAAGDCVECNVPADCPGVDDDCNKRTCSAAGECDVDYTPNNTPVSMQTDGDCQEIVCDGDGGTDSDDDNTDLPDDGFECTTDTCKLGNPQFTPRASGTACSEGGGKVCNGMGACVECTGDAQCGASTACVTYDCANFVCAPPVIAAAGTSCGGLSKCNGLGSCVQCAAPATLAFNGPAQPVAIPNGDNLGIESTLTAVGLGASIVDVNVTLNIASDTSGDLGVTLESPAGTIIELTSGNGGSNDNNFAGTTFDDDSNSVRVTKALFINMLPVASAIPERNLGLFTGENPNGTWRLRVKDIGVEGLGSTLNSWSLSIAAQPGNAGLSPATFSNNNAVATVDGLEVSSSIPVAGVTGDAYAATVTVDLAHPWSEQLVVTLTSPLNKSVTLLSADGGTSANVFTGTTFSDAAPLLAGCSGAGCVTYVTGVVVPMAIPAGSLSALIGDAPNGTWTLKVQDTAVGDSGVLNGWSLSITPSLCTL